MSEKTPEELSNQTDYMFKYSQITADEKFIAENRCKDLFLYYAMDKLHSNMREFRTILIDAEASSLGFCQHVHPDILTEVYEELEANNKFDEDVLDTINENDLIKSAIEYAHKMTKAKILEKAERRSAEIERMKRLGRNNPIYFKE